FRPGKVYPEMYIRDIAWGMEAAQYYYPDEYLRQPVEAYLARQYTASTRSLDGDFGVVPGAGAIGGILTPNGDSNKQTIVADEETSLIHAAYLYYNMTYNTAWLQKEIAGLPVITRLNRAADWLLTHRLDPQTGLIWRGHTTDWGDVKFEKGPGYTDFNPAQDHKTASIYDQAMAYLALVELATMNAALGDTARADQWQTAAEALKTQTNALLWQVDKGFYLTHLHLTPLEHPFDESEMVSISNAVAVYAGLTDQAQTGAIFQNLERARQAARVRKPGLSLYPYYPDRWPNRFFDYPGMGNGNYQNGGVWDWWGGVQVQAEFSAGYSALAREHLLLTAHDWKTHPGDIREWESSTDPRHLGSSYYSAAAGTMGRAIIEGLFGVSLTGQGAVIQPRLGLNDGFIRIYQPATDRYVAYSFDWGQEVNRLDYGTNAPAPVQIKILLLATERVQEVRLDGAVVAFDVAQVGQDSFLTLQGPSGEHRVELLKTTSSAASAPTPTGGNGGPGVSLNLAPTPEHLPVTVFRPTPVPLPSPAAADRPAADPARLRQGYLRLLRYASAGLVLLTSLGLLVLAFLRRVVGLG
ncbi:MAG: hypothetical protein D6784_10940, partial [Chloroflexi bacterium]